MAAEGCAEQDRECREDEVEALEAIFGDDFWVKKGRETDRYTLRVAEDAEGNASAGDAVLLEYYLPSDYPSNSPPAYTLRLESNHQLDATRADRLRAELGELFEAEKGEAILFSWAGKVREHLPLLLAMASAEGSAAESDEEDGAGGGTGWAPRPAGGEEEPEGAAEALQIVHGEPIVDRKSTFQAHLARVRTERDVRAVREFLLRDRKVARATHNIAAWRVWDVERNAQIADNDDDGETAAGGRLAELLQVTRVNDVVVVVSRWYGGVKLGPDRFKLINNAARTLLEREGVLEEARSR